MTLVEISSSRCVEAITYALQVAQCHREFGHTTGEGCCTDCQI
jgi:hypothetical protein